MKILLIGIVISLAGNEIAKKKRKKEDPLSLEMIYDVQVEGYYGTFGL